ncbi:uncharacterized protein EI90DRAFT_2923928, partial [Cantharellus anzutake]|uniref:uncharacterized protein n=1 Tax=Cantharellus anzutake TaxID=1750568 RepID=UPI0019058D42
SLSHTAVAYYHRARLAPYVPQRLLSILPTSFFGRFGRHYVPLSTFEAQRDAGLSSNMFDLEGNIDGDSRVGLDERGEEEVRRIMQARGVTFDQARLIRHKEYLARNGIDPNTGMPLDSKAITRL